MLSPLPADDSWLFPRLLLTADISVDMASGKNKQYGLILPSKGAVAAAKKTNVFGDDSDSDSDGGGDWVKKSLKREAQQSVQKRATKVQMKKALEEDPTVFQYDEIYDDLEQKKEETKDIKKSVEKKPRYIQALLQTAERRKKENERRVERQVQKEREEEGNEFADKESFVTSSYRQKLEEFKKQEEEEKRMERLEAIGDVTRQKDMTGFYRHLYRQTMGESLPGANLATDSGKEENSLPEIVESTQENTEQTSPASGDEVSKKDERKKDRHYRKRRSSSTCSENSDEDKAAVVKKATNIDADSDFTGSSSSDSDTETSGLGSGSEEGKVAKKKKASEKADQIPRKKHKKDNSVKEDSATIDTLPPVEKKPLSTMPVVKEEKLSEDESSKSEEKETRDVKTNSDILSDKVKHEVKPKINIWAKRTVGQALDDAVQRYYERKAAREALRRA